MLNQAITIKGRYLKAPNLRVYLRLTVTGLPGYERDDASGLRWRNPVGLPGRPRFADVPQVERQAHHRAPELSRARHQAQGAGHDPDGLRRPGDPTGRSAAGLPLRTEGGRGAPGQEGLDLSRIVAEQAGIGRDPTRGPSSRAGSCPRTFPVTPHFTWERTTAGRTSLSCKAGSPHPLDTRKVGPDGRRIGSMSSIEKTDPSWIELLYLNVKLNPAIRVEEFAFQAPPTATVDDSTEMIVRGLDQAISHPGR